MIFPPTVKIISLIVLLCFLTTCNASPSPEFEILLVSHYWNGPQEKAVLTQIFEDFMKVNPDIVVLYESTQDVQQDFQTRTLAGLGPDMLIGLPYREITSLSEAGLLKNISGYQLAEENYRTQHLNALRQEDKLYALPFMVVTSLMYFNKTLVTTPPATLEALVTETTIENSVAIKMNQNDAMWGVNAFGDSLIDQNSVLQPNRDNYLRWFEWLKNNQGQPGIIFDDQQQLLEEKFINGEAAYLVASTMALERLRQALGKETVGVAPLPDSPYGVAGPLASLEVIAFSLAATPAKIEPGLRLAQYLTNASLQQKLVLNDLGRAPTNPRTVVRRNLSEIASTVVRQGRTSMVLPLSYMEQFDSIETQADAIYIELLDGDLSPEDAADRMMLLFDE